MKFFLFRREAVGPASERKSNTGDGLSVFGVPAENLSHITAEGGAVNFVFKDAGLYEYSTPQAHEGMERVRVSVACNEGEEFDFIRNVMEFVAAESKKSVMVFDTVNNFSTFPQAKVEGKGQVTTVLPQNPIVLSTGDTSPTTVPFQTPIAELAGVTFTSNTQFPIVDYNETTLSALSIGDEVTTWVNSGSAGSASNITSNTGAPVYSRDVNNDMRTTAVTVAAADILHVADEFEVDGDFTMYMVYALTNGVVEMGSIYGDTSGQCKGFGNATTESKVYFTFHGMTGRPAEARTDTTDNGTIAYKLQDPKLDSVTTANATYIGAQRVYTLIVRRDKDFNIYVHNHTGDVIAFIPANIGGLVTRDFRTDGKLRIDRIGNSDWKGEIARFGVIDTDIGTSEAARIAQQLHVRYNYYDF